MATPPRRIPPPPTRHGAAPGQPKVAARPARGTFAAPPPHWRTPPDRYSGTVAPTSVQRQRLPVPPPRAGSHRAGIVQRAEVSLKIPKAKRPVVKCTMGQGVTGYLDRVVLASDQFSSCSPIILYNAKTRFAGLFHFYAKGLAKQEESLRLFYKRVQPTVIYLNDRSVKFEWMTEISRDHKDQREFFEDECGFEGKFIMLPVKGDGYAATLDDAGEIAVTGTSTLGIHLDYTSDQAKWVAKPPSLSSGELETAIEGVELFGKNLW